MMLSLFEICNVPYLGLPRFLWCQPEQVQSQQFWKNGIFSWGRRFPFIWNDNWTLFTYPIFFPRHSAAKTVSTFFTPIFWAIRMQLLLSEAPSKIGPVTPPPKHTQHKTMEPPAPAVCVRFLAGLPDFSSSKHTKNGKLYRMIPNYAKRP
jgi:hypothetical protein